MYAYTQLSNIPRLTGRLKKYFRTNSAILHSLYKYIQLPLLTTYTHLDQQLHEKVQTKRFVTWSFCLFSREYLNDDKEEERRIFNSSELLTTGAWYWKDRAPSLFRLMCGTVRRGEGSVCLFSLCLCFEPADSQDGSNSCLSAQLS